MMMQAILTVPICLLIKTVHYQTSWLSLAILLTMVMVLSGYVSMARKPHIYLSRMEALPSLVTRSCRVTRPSATQVQTKLSHTLRMPLERVLPIGFVPMERLLLLLRARHTVLTPQEAHTRRRQVHR